MRREHNFNLIEVSFIIVEVSSFSTRKYTKILLENDFSFKDFSPYKITFRPPLLQFSHQRTRLLPFLY